jgi:hypothetical protein
LGISIANEKPDNKKDGSLSVDLSYRSSDSQEDVFEQMLRDKINSMFTKSEFDRLLHCLRRIGKLSKLVLLSLLLLFSFFLLLQGMHSHQVLQPFYVKIFQVLPKITVRKIEFLSLCLTHTFQGEFKSIALELILWNAESIDDVAAKIQPEIGKLLSYRNDANQLLSLKILLKVR